VKLKSLDLLNFQSHEDTSLKFCGGVNVIIGASDSGKSSICRALNWVRTNRPMGDSFITKGKKDTKVTVEVGEYRIVRAKKAGQGGTYTVAGKEFKALRGNVPEEVSALLGNNDILYQHQLEPHYLVTDSAGRMAEAVGRIVDLENLMRARKWTDSREREERRNVDAAREEIGGIDEQLKAERFDRLDEIREAVDAWGEDEDSHERIMVEMDRLAGLVDSFYEVDGAIRKMPSEKKIAGIRKLMGGIEKRQRQWAAVDSEANDLLGLVKAAKESEERRGLRGKVGEGIWRTVELQSSVRDWGMLADRIGALASLIGQVEEIDIEYGDLAEGILECTGTARSLRSRLTNCPMCGSELTEDMKRKVLDG